MERLGAIMTDYMKIAKNIDKALISREDEFVYLLYPNPPKNGNILFEERGNTLIFWSNDYKEMCLSEIIAIIEANTDCDILVPYIESKEEYDLLLSLGYSPVEFTVEDNESLVKEYGSVIKKKRGI